MKSGDKADTDRSRLPGLPYIENRFFLRYSLSKIPETGYSFHLYLFLPYASKELRLRVACIINTLYNL